MKKSYSCALAGPEECLISVLRTFCGVTWQETTGSPKKLRVVISGQQLAKNPKDLNPLTARKEILPLTNELE